MSDDRLLFPALVAECTNPFEMAPKGQTITPQDHMSL